MLVFPLCKLFYRLCLYKTSSCVVYCEILIPLIFQCKPAKRWSGKDKGNLMIWPIIWVAFKNWPTMLKISFLTHYFHSVPKIPLHFNSEKICFFASLQSPRLDSTEFDSYLDSVNSTVFDCFRQSPRQLQKKQIFFRIEMQGYFRYRMEIVGQKWDVPFLWIIFTIMPFIYVKLSNFIFNI